MGDENKLLKGLLIGAAVGACVALLDKKTRQELIEKGKQTTECMKHYVQNPSEVTDKIKTALHDVRETLHTVSEDITFMNEKVKEIKDLTPKVIELIDETREKIKSHSKEE